MANMFDRTASDDDDLDARARALAGGPTQRDRSSSEGRPSALDRARGRGYASSDDGIETAKRERDLEGLVPSEQAPPTRPSQAIEPVPRYDPTGGAAGAAGVEAGQGRRPIPPTPARAASEPSPPFKVPDNYDPTGQRDAAATLTPLGSGNRPIPPGDYKWPKWSDRPTWAGGRQQGPPYGPGTPPTSPEEGWGEARGAPEAGPGEPKIVPTDDEAGFRPGPLAKRPGVTPPGKGGPGGGGGGGGAPRGRPGLGIQSRTEAYDPEKDRADPRNIAIVDDSGRTNPKLREQAEKGAIEPTAPGVRTGEAAAKFTNHYTGALAGASTYMEDIFHQKTGDPAQGEGYQAMTAKAVGAPDQKTVDGVFKVVDPNNELAPKERMELATRAMHDWYSAKGDTKNADKVAAEMLQYGNKQAQGFGKQVVAALKSGNRQAATEAIQKAYDWLPDGYHADVQGNNLVITDTASNKTINQIPLDDKMIQNLGVGLASGTLYWDIVRQRAGQPGFAPPKSAPTEAIATAPPTGGAASAPGPAVLQAGPGAPVAPPPPPGPAPGAAPVRPPGAAVAPPVAPGTPPTPPPPPVTPPSNRPVVPAPAAPGPGTTQQAAPPVVNTDPGVPMAPLPTQGDGGPPGSPAGQPSEPKPAMDTKVPPALKGPVQPSTTKRPIVAGENAPTETKTAETKTPEVKTGETKKPEERFVYPNDDRDAPPIDKTTGKEYVYRRRTVSHTPEVKEALANIKDINQRYTDELKEYVGDMKTPGLNLKDKEVAAAFGARKKFIDERHKADLKEQENVVKTFNTQQKAADEKEAKGLEPRRATGQERAEAIQEIDAQLKAVIDSKDKKDSLYKVNPVRLEAYNDAKKWAPIRNAILEIQAHNRHLPTEQVTRQVITAISHMESGPNDKQQTLNTKIGKEGAHYKVLGVDVNNNYVVQVGGGKEAVALHMPPETFNQISKLRSKSYEAKAGDMSKAYAEWQKQQENDKLRQQANKRRDPHGTLEKSILKRGGGAGEEPPKEP